MLSAFRTPTYRVRSHKAIVHRRPILWQHAVRTKSAETVEPWDAQVPIRPPVTCEPFLRRALLKALPRDAHQTQKGRWSISQDRGFSRIKDILCKVEARTGQTLVETLGAAISLMNALGILMVLSRTASMAPGAQSLRRTLYDVILLTPVQRLAR
jgi:hypothetical protein